MGGGSLATSAHPHLATLTKNRHWCPRHNHFAPARATDLTWPLGTPLVALAGLLRPLRPSSRRARHRVLRRRTLLPTGADQEHRHCGTGTAGPLPCGEVAAVHVFRATDRSSHRPCRLGFATLADPMVPPPKTPKVLHSFSPRSGARAGSGEGAIQAVTAPDPRALRRFEAKTECGGPAELKRDACDRLATEPISTVPRTGFPPITIIAAKRPRPLAAEHVCRRYLPGLVPPDIGAVSS